MTKKELVMVLGVTVVGLAPAYGVYHYVLEHPIIPVSVVIAQPAAVGLAQPTVYQSQPVKETDGSCKNSYYATFLLTVESQTQFSLRKRCESARDRTVMWQGTVAKQESASSTSAALTFTLLSKDETSLEKPAHFTLEEREGEYVVSDSLFAEMASTTRFAPITEKAARE